MSETPTHKPHPDAKVYPALDTIAGILERALAAGTSNPRNLCALLKQIFSIMGRTRSSRSGIRPSSISCPIRLHSTRRKYSWRGYDIKERESVTMPTKRDSNPVFE